MAEPFPEASPPTAPEQWRPSSSPDFGKTRRFRGGAAVGAPTVGQDERGLQVKPNLKLCGLHTVASPARSGTFRTSAQS